MSFTPSFYTLNCRGRLLSLEQPQIMGILNLTPDSFSDGGKFNKKEAAIRQTEKMLQEGAKIIDIGGYSSRPYAPEVSEKEELQRIEGITASILREFPEAIVSIDTYRPKVARIMLESGAHIINDISAGHKIEKGESMMEVLASFPDVPYIMMHMQGLPRNMQDKPEYEDVIEEIFMFFVEKVMEAKNSGIKDLIIDPGFGFGKKILHNYQLLAGLDQFQELNLPVLAGISRKSMIYKLFETTPDDVIELTSILHFKAIEKGADLLRVHDVKEARRTIQLHQYLLENGLI